MNFEEITKKLSELEISNHLFGNDCLSDSDEDLEKIFGPIELVEDNAGYEGGGEQCSMVWHFKKQNVYIKWDGWYASGDGSHWEESGYEVTPKRVINIEYIKPTEVETLKNDLEKALKEQCVAFLDDLRVYESENQGLICNDDRSSAEFYEIFLENK